MIKNSFSATLPILVHSINTDSLTESISCSTGACINVESIAYYGSPSLRKQSYMHHYVSSGGENESSKT